MKTILIVEDVDMNIELLTQLLEDDYKVITARDGQAGVEMTTKHKPDLILMDMSLPIKDGWTATAEIKRNVALKHIPILGLSAHAMGGDRERAIKAGCNEYLTKPIDEDLLFEKLAIYLR